MVAQTMQTAELIPIDKISVVNPRVRNRKVFDEIVENIAELGLKRPIMSPDQYLGATHAFIERVLSRLGETHRHDV